MWEHLIPPHSHLGRVARNPEIRPGDFAGLLSHMLFKVTPARHHCIDNSRLFPALETPALA